MPDPGAPWEPRSPSGGAVRSFRAVTQRTVLLVDRSTLGRANPASVVRLGEVDDIVTDGPLPDAWRERLAADGPRIQVECPLDRPVPDATGVVADV